MFCLQGSHAQEVCMLLRADIPASCPISNCTRSPCLWRPCQYTHYQSLQYASAGSSFFFHPTPTSESRQMSMPVVLRSRSGSTLVQKWVFKCNEIPRRSTSRIPHLVFSSSLWALWNTYGMNSGFSSLCESQSFVNTLLSLLSSDTKEFGIWYMPTQYDTLQWQLLKPLAPGLTWAVKIVPWPTHWPIVQPLIRRYKIPNTSTSLTLIYIALSYHC